MSKICLIRQPNGLGDIIFLQKLNKAYLDKGYIVIHPVHPTYNYLKDYIKNGTYFLPLSGDFFGKNV